MKRNTVLIVDDEKNVRLTLTRALETLDLGLETAVNGEEALRTLGEREFDLVLLDLRMPGMSGTEVLRRVRETRPHVPVIVITAHGTVESAVELTKLGAVDVIPKPFAPDEIRALVTRVLDRDGMDAERARGYEQHVELAKRCLGRREFDAAQEHLRLAIAADESQPEAFNLLGVLEELGGDWLGALKKYRAALALDPTYRPAHENLDRVVVRDEKGRGVDLG